MSFWRLIYSILGLRRLYFKQVNLGLKSVENIIKYLDEYRIGALTLEYKLILVYVRHLFTISEAF